MAARAAKATARERAGIDADAVLTAYAAWLKRQPLATRSRDAYLAQVRNEPTPDHASRQNVSGWCGCAGRGTPS
ncbi:MAG: hypothetical protein ACR2MO_10880 [Acidimicrobiales bacterium]